MPKQSAGMQRHPTGCQSPALNPSPRSRTADTAGNIKAGDETRTRNIQLGRLMLYQLSYARSIVSLWFFNDLQSVQAAEKKDAKGHSFS